MNIESIESEYGFKYPKKFHEIYETGAMEYMTISIEEYISRRDEFEKDPEVFLLMLKDCGGLLSFEEYDSEMEELNKLIEINREINNMPLNPNYRLIPFAWAGDQSKFCL